MLWCYEEELDRFGSEGETTDFMWVVRFVVVGNETDGWLSFGVCECFFFFRYVELSLLERRPCEFLEVLVL